MFTLSSSLQFPSNLNKMQFIKQCIDFFLYLKQYNPYSFIHSFILVELPFKGRRTDIRGADWHFPFIFHKDSSPSQYSYINLLSGVRHHFYTSFLPSPPSPSILSPPLLLLLWLFNRLDLWVPTSFGTYVFAPIYIY